jgi:DNA-binding CsgD family transcriptional regulator
MGIPIESLTARERECLRLVARDRSTGEIARQLSISINTVDNHIKNAKRKLGTTDRFSAARALAVHEGRSQSLASLGSAMEAAAPAGQSDDAAASNADVVRDDGPHKRATLPAASPDAWRRRGDPKEAYGARSTFHVVGRIVLILAGLLIIAVAAPALVNSAQMLADSLRPRNH